MGDAPAAGRQRCSTASRAPPRRPSTKAIARGIRLGKGIDHGHARDCDRSTGSRRSMRLPVAMMPSTCLSSMASTWSWPRRGSSSTLHRNTETPLSTSAFGDARHQRQGEAAIGIVGEQADGEAALAQQALRQAVGAEAQAPGRLADPLAGLHGHSPRCRSAPSRRSPRSRRRRTRLPAASPAWRKRDLARPAGPSAGSSEVRGRMTPALEKTFSQPTTASAQAQGTTIAHLQEALDRQPGSCLLIRNQMVAYLR